MECAALFSPLVIQSLEASSGYGFEERRVRPLCHLLIRQQTWQELVFSAVITRLQLHRPTREADSYPLARWISTDKRRSGKFAANPSVLDYLRMPVAKEKPRLCRT